MDQTSGIKSLWLSSAAPDEATSPGWIPNSTEWENEDTLMYERKVRPEGEPESTCGLSLSSGTPTNWLHGAITLQIPPYFSVEHLSIPASEAGSSQMLPRSAITSPSISMRSLALGLYLAGLVTLSLGLVGFGQSALVLLGLALTALALIFWASEKLTHS